MMLDCNDFACISLRLHIITEFFCLLWFVNNHIISWIKFASACAPSQRVLTNKCEMIKHCIPARQMEAGTLVVGERRAFSDKEKTLRAGRRSRAQSECHKNVFLHKGTTRLSRLCCGARPGGKLLSLICKITAWRAKGGENCANSNNCKTLATVFLSGGKIVKL